VSDYQAPITNAIPMPAPVAPILDQLPIQDAQVPDLPSMPQLPAPSAEAIAVAHEDMMDGDLKAAAEVRARLGLDGGSASVDSSLQYGTPGNGATIHGGADTQSQSVYGGAELALTDEQLRAKLAGDMRSGPGGTQGNIHGLIEGGDEQSAARFEVGMSGVGHDPNLYGSGHIRIGDPDAFNLQLSGQGSQLTTRPQGTVAATMGGPLAPGVTAASTAHLTTDGQTTQAGGTGTIGVQTPVGTINAYGEGQTNGTTSSGGAGVLFNGQF
jgi:hypothetical protein